MMGSTSHLQQNSGQYVPKKSMRESVANDIRSIFNAPNKDQANHLLKHFVHHYQKQAPDLSNWAENNIPEGFTVFNLPDKHRKKMRTTNMLERLNQEIKRRTRVAIIFPNKESCERLISAMLMETSEEWIASDKRYIPETD